MRAVIRYIPVVLFMSLAACSGDIKQTLGLNRTGPDEFRVYSRPALSVPPEFNLRPPGQGDENASGISASDQARSSVLGTSSETGLPNSPSTGPASTAVPAVTANELPSNADAQFLSDAGAPKADPQIRQEIKNDTLNGVVPKDNTYLFGGKKESDAVVDPAKEAQRLKTDKDSNQPPSAGGDTPAIEPQNKGILGDIF